MKGRLERENKRFFWGIRGRRSPFRIIIRIIGAMKFMDCATVAFRTKRPFGIIIKTIVVMKLTDCATITY